MRLMADRLWMRRSTLTTSLVLCLCLVLSKAASAQVSHRTITWTTPDGAQVAAALNVTELSPTFMMSRMLVEAPKGERAVLTETIEFHAGRTTQHLLHEASGWWIQVRMDMGIHATDWKDFFNRAYDALEKPGARLRVELLSSENLRWDGNVDVRGGWLSTTLKELGGDLAQESIGQTLHAGTPPELPSILEFLARELRLGMTGENFRTMIDLVEPLLGTSEPSPVRETQKLTREDGEFTIGLDFAEGRFSELVKRFQSIDPRQPTKIQ